MVYGHVIAKFSRMVCLPHFLTHGAPLRAPCARELRYNNSNDVTRILEWRFISLSYLRLAFPYLHDDQIFTKKGHEQYFASF